MMEPIAPNQTPTNEAPSPLSPKTSNKDSHWKAVLAVSLFVLLSLGAVAFLFYQNQKLKSMLAAYQSQASPTPTATADPTANWETYINEKMKISFKYPTSGGLQIFDSQFNEYNISLNTAQYAPLYLEVAYLPNSELQDWYKKAYGSTKQDDPTPPPLTDGPMVGGFKSYFSDFNFEGAGKVRFIFLPIGKDLYQINLPITENEMQYQILSTFKFLESKACTQEAKLCPDGSAVGRTEPDCEFAPCPTP